MLCLLNLIIRDNKLMRPVTILFLIIALFGCVDSEEHRANLIGRYSQQSSYVLCESILNNRDTYEWERNPRLEVLASRDEDCLQYLHLINPENEH